jgi:hypothetical protein
MPPLGASRGSSFVEARWRHLFHDFIWDRLGELLRARYIRVCCGVVSTTNCFVSLSLTMTTTISLRRAFDLYADALRVLLPSFHHTPLAQRNRFLQDVGAGAHAFFEAQPSAPADRETINECVIKFIGYCTRLIRMLVTIYYLMS